MLSIVKTAVSLWLLLLCLASNTRGSFDSWVQRNPLPQGSDINALIFTNGMYVALGDETLLTSSNGTAWTVHSAAVPGRVFAVTFANQEFIAVGGNGLILISSNALEWARIDSPVSNDLFGVTFGAGIYMAVGDTGLVLTSEDARHWFVRAPYPQGASLRGVIHAQNQFLAVGDYGEIGISPDGVTWTRRASGTFNHLNAVTYANGKFVAIGGQEGIQLSTVLYSSNSVDWVNRSSATIRSALQAITVCNGRFIAVGDDSFLARSTDAHTWTVARQPTPNGMNQYYYLKAIACSTNNVVTAGSAGVMFNSSTNATLWTNQSAGNLVNIATIDYGNGRFVAAGFDYMDLYPVALSSLDGVRWSRSLIDPVNRPFIFGGTFGSGLFVLVAESGAIYTSRDGLSWTNSAPGLTNRLEEVAYLNGHFLAMGHGGGLFTSPDGTSWSILNTGTTNVLVGAAYGNGIYVVIPAGYPRPPYHLVSDDGLEWRRSPTHTPIDAVAFGNGRFVGMGWRTNSVSTDGVVWTSVPLPQSLYPYTVQFHERTFIILGYRESDDQTCVLSSTDGLNWQLQETGTYRYLSDISGGSDSIIAVGWMGMILESRLLVQPHFRKVIVEMPGRLNMWIHGQVNRKYILQRMSADEPWTDYLVFTNSSSLQQVLDSEPMISPRRLYRVFDPAIKN